MWLAKKEIFESLLDWADTSHLNGTDEPSLRVHSPVVTGTVHNINWPWREIYKPWVLSFGDGA